MPRGRFLSKSISLDEKVNALSDDTARLLFTWLISHLDCEGRLHGDAMTVKSIVFPRRKISERRINKYLDEIANAELILRYSVNGNSYLLAPNFEKHQTGLQKGKEAQSQIPPFTPELLQSKGKLTPPQVKAKVKVKVEDKVEDKDVPTKKSYGEFNNVLLSDNEYQKLIERFGEGEVKEKVEVLSTGIASKGYKYKDHYATILAWDKKDRREIGSGTHKKSSRQLIGRRSYTRPETLTGVD